ncbi:CAMK/CAMKL protein kinase [Salpingoeca rosetta]|uniref:CAMK/CAMKL protein kinase n=1 Tax=Salpingoeca rosetta (strain ATCC 50818 / BSB-021) TaxID=946362 RepID=F2TYX9_SALR5|nr:CAMK/CAMKL protein kinase [Salpingoeca rosetta]EGD78803.1 CAMK/CAMKL protein kinase [Salpingoeca rosetta]|eukprot:XP_004997759.1 CAMK/CAMKL protein kinase [Salpingoeca rosetta]
MTTKLTVPSMASRRRGVSAPPPMEWMVHFEPASEAGKVSKHVSAHKGKYPDELIDHYSVGYTVGDGGFSKVKLARHRMTGIKVAIKMISKETLQRQGELFRAANEIAALQLLKHQNIARLFQVLESRSRVYLVMEHLPAGELFDYIVAQGRIRDEMVARKLFRQIVSAVAHSHQEGFAHRDLKPENMLFDEKKVLKLIDFGLVSMPHTEQCKTSCGSANYAAPEVIRGESYSGPAADMWSLGIVAYAMLCGCLPFDDPDLRVLGSLIRKGEYAEPSHLSPSARDMIRGLLSLDPARRMTMDQLLAHPWMVAGLPTDRLDTSSQIECAELDPQVVGVLARYYGVSEDRVRSHLETDPYDHVTADYEMVCLAKTKRLPLRLIEGAGTFQPRELPEIEVEQPDADSDATGDGADGAGRMRPGSALSNASSTISTPDASRAGSPRTRRGRRRGMSETLQVPNVDAMTPRSGNWLSARFNSMRTLAQPLIVSDSNLGINFKSKADAETVRQAIYAHLSSLPGEVRVKNRMFRLDVLMRNDLSDNQEIRLHFEIVRIVDPPLTGIRVTRVKGDRAQVQKACLAIFEDFKV